MEKICLTIAASMIGISSAIIHPEVKAGYCWYETAWYEKYGCTIERQLNNGKYLLLCCN